MKKLLIGLLFITSLVRAQTSDSGLKSGINTLLRVNTETKRVDDAALRDKEVNSKLSRLEPNVATGTDTYATTLSWCTGYVIGLNFPVIFNFANTGPSTLNVNGFGAVPIKKNGSTALSSSDIHNGQQAWVYYDGTNFQISLGGSGGSVSTGNLTTSTTGVSIGSGTGAVVGSGSTINIQTANGSQPGLLNSSDWNTFNQKIGATGGTAIVAGNGSGGLLNINIGTNLSYNTSTQTLDASGSGGGTTGAFFLRGNGSGGFTNLFSPSDGQIIRKVAGPDYDNSGISSDGTTATFGAVPNFPSQTQNKSFMSPNGSSGVPSFRSIVTADILGWPANASGVLTNNGSGTLSWGAGGTSTPTANTTSQWDANVNFSANNFIPLNTSTATAGATTTLTVASTQVQYFTGTLNQIIKMPVTSTLVLPIEYKIYNLSSGILTVIASDGLTMFVIYPDNYLSARCVSTSTTSILAWDCRNQPIDSKPPARNSFAYVQQGVAMDWIGDSYTLSVQSSASKGFPQIVNQMVAGGGTLNNYAISGIGVLQGVRTSYSSIGGGTAHPTVITLGFNDVNKNGNSTTLNAKTYEKLKTGIRGIIANSRIVTGSQIAANNGAVTTTGAWLTTSGISDKASLAIGGLVRTSVVAGSTLTWTVTTAQNQGIIIGTFATDEVITTGGDFTYAVDGGPALTFSGKNKTDGISDGTIDNSLCPTAIIIFGLSPGSHTLVITTLSTAMVRIDYLALSQDSKITQPIIVNSCPILNSALGYPASGSDAVMAQGSKALREVVQEYPEKFNIFFCDITKFFYPPTDLAGDNTHPNDLGYYHIARAIYEVFKPDVPATLALTIGNTTDVFGFINQSSTTLSLSTAQNRVTGLFPNVSLASSQIRLNTATTDGNIAFYTHNTNGVTPIQYMNLDKLGNLLVGQAYITSTGNEALGVLRSNGNAAMISMTNINSGPAATARFQASTASNFSTKLIMEVASGGYTTNVMRLANAALIYTDMGAGMNVFTNNSTALGFGTNNIYAGNINTSQQWFFGGSTSATALVHHAAGTTAASTAPEKFTSGPLMTVIEAGAGEYNNARYFSSNALNRYAPGGSIADFTSDVGNSGSAETDLFTYTTKASTLGATGEKLTFTVTGTIVGSATASRTINCYFAGTNIGAITSATISTSGSFKATIEVIRTGSTTARTSVSLSADNLTLTTPITETDLTSLTFTNTNIIKITGTSSGTGSASNDVVAKLGWINWFPSANN